MWPFTAKVGSVINRNKILMSCLNLGGGGTQKLHFCYLDLCLYSCQNLFKKISRPIFLPSIAMACDKAIRKASELIRSLLADNLK